jgi:cellulose synthase/poly-beta-1,6-N-acetylglucosamine synthase-like glycosyltransferase
MLISVILSTWNRASLLRQTLEGMTKLSAPEDASWELVVVDNNCTDSTPAVIGEFSSLLPLRAISEPTPGLSNGRNAGVAAATGDYVVVTDDDVLVCPDWLRAYATAFTTYSDAAVFGGPIIPWFSVPRPDWLVRCMSEVANVYASLQPNVGQVPLGNGLLPFGPNMAFRRDVLGDRPFSPELGRVGRGMLACEETFLIRDLFARGFSGRWVPDAKLQHYVREEQLTTEYIRRWNKGYGATMARLDSERPEKLLFGSPRWMWRDLLTAECRYRIKKLFHGPDRWIGDMQRANFLSGYMTEYRSRRDERSNALGLATTSPER